MATIFPSTPTIGDEYNGYSWDGTSWNLIGNQYNPASYSASAPANPKPGDIWIESDVDVPSISPETILTTSVAASTYQPLVSGVSSTEIGYLDGVTSSIQTQLNNSVPGIVNIVPSNVTVGSGTATVAANGEVTFTGVTHINLDNIFSSTYSSYRVDMYFGTGGASSRLYTRMLNSSGSPVTGTNYYGSFHWWNITNGHGVEGTGNGGPISYATFGVLSNYAGKLVADYSIGGDHLVTSFMQSFDYGSVASNYISGVSSPRGIQIYPSGGNFSGTVRIYGYNKGV